MQRRKTGKFSIFDSLDVIFDCLMSRVESASSNSAWDRYRVELRCSTRVFKLNRDVQFKYLSRVRM